MYLWRQVEWSVRVSFPVRKECNRVIGQNEESNQTLEKRYVNIL